MTQNYDIIIVGGGLVGLTAALACAHKGARIAVLDHIDPSAFTDTGFDGRASAIAASSFNMFKRLGVSKTLEGHIQPITDILISDGEAGRAASPLTLHFNSQDIGGHPMGYMVENRRLRQAILEHVTRASNIDLMAPAAITLLERTSEVARAGLSDDRVLEADLIVGADGRNSFCRKQAGIDISLTPYKQKAIVTTVEHSQPHNGVAHELFLPSGPFAILPLTDNRANIVWTDSPRAVEAAMALSEDAFAAELARRFGDFLGDVRPCAPRWSYPLSLQLAERYTDTRLALIGDAAHAIHPIAGQGLNMGLRDAAALADCVQDALEAGLDMGHASLETYSKWRNFDNGALAASTDIFNRLFSNRLPPLQHARRLGLGLIDKNRMARVFFIKEASGQLGDLPSLLRA